MKRSRPSEDSTVVDTPNHSGVSQFQKVSAAVFYGVSSLLVIFTNKAIMTAYKFKFFDILATVQFLVTTFILTVLVLCGKVDVPALSWPLCKEILPITFMFLGNVLCGLGSTKSLNIPMFTALRRFSIIFTMLGEFYLLKTKPSCNIVLSVVFMVGGTVIASFYDLSFDPEGYFLVFLNNLFTALNGVYMKKASISGKCSKMGILFYNSLFSAIVMVGYFVVEHAAISMATVTYPGQSSTNNLRGGLGAGFSSMILPTSGDAQIAVASSTLSKVFSFPAWPDNTFVIMFILAVSMGSVLNYSIFLCTTVNSPLTTAVVGATKNIATTYIGMMIFDDYSFTWVNFIGINISILGSLYYTYMILFRGATGFGGTG